MKEYTIKLKRNGKVIWKFVSIEELKLDDFTVDLGVRET